MNLTPVFDRLRAIMRPYADRLDVKNDTASELYVDTRHIQKNKKPLFFGAVQMNLVGKHPKRASQESQYACLKAVMPPNSPPARGCPCLRRGDRGIQRLRIAGFPLIPA
ncbi:MAG: hypothetical protein RMN52_11880 [Anaerolineae bacterium]|nr:hypothetical protein [Candidatus Roseilinea sp.]MDW8450689.1 hypothetical protein [Anaerolineae bacterium]